MIFEFSNLRSLYNFMMESPQFHLCVHDKVFVTFREEDFMQGVTKISADNMSKEDLNTKTFTSEEREAALQMLAEEVEKIMNPDSAKNRIILAKEGE